MNGVDTQTQDGRWIEAQPIPFFRDTRPLWRRALAAFVAMIRLRDADAIAEEAERNMVPVEPSAAERRTMRSGR